MMAEHQPPPCGISPPAPFELKGSPTWGRGVTRHNHTPGMVQLSHRSHAHISSIPKWEIPVPHTTGHPSQPTNPQISESTRQHTQAAGSEGVLMGVGIGL